MAQNLLNNRLLGLISAAGTENSRPDPGRQNKPLLKKL
jgi:hypothetical protein